MKNAMQFKAMIKKIAEQNHISAQLVLQNYMLERLLERISISEYKSNFIIKGGFLIAAMVGLDTRATMDLDATIKGIAVNASSIHEIFEEICGIDIADDVEFTFESVADIRKDAEYSGYRVSLKAYYPPIVVPLKLDITTGDKITPKEITYKFKLLFESKEISVLAYNLESVLAEKIETIISRGDLNTRPRDFYDVYILRKLQSANIDMGILKQALMSTCESRNSSHIIVQYKKIIGMILTSKTMVSQWENYRKDFEYARHIEFGQTCESVIEILDDLRI